MATFMPSFRAEATRRNDQQGLAVVAQIDKITPPARRKRIIARLDRMIRDYIVDLGDVKIGVHVTWTRLFWQKRFNNVVRFLKAQLAFIP